MISTKTHNFLKIGYTNRDPEERAKELSGTSSPHPHMVEYSALMENPKSVEKTIHDLLVNSNEGKEWFKCTVQEAVNIIRETAGTSILYEFCRNDFLDDKTINCEEARDPNRKYFTLFSSHEIVSEIFLLCVTRYYPFYGTEGREAIQRLGRDANFIRLLSRNEYIEWTEDLIHQYYDSWNWADLSANRSIPFSSSLIKKYIGDWDTTELLNNPAFHDNVPEHMWPEIIRRVKARSEVRIPHYAQIAGLDDREFDELVMHWGFKEWDLLSAVRDFPWDKERLEKYWGYLDWSCLGKNTSVPWTFELIEEYEALLDWRTMAWNESVPWDRQLIEQYEELWDWDGLSSNRSLPWSSSFITKYARKWNWVHLSQNEALPWNIDLIETYVDRWDWKKLSANRSLPWGYSLLDKYLYKWTWREIADLDTVPWSNALIQRYENEWDYNAYGERCEIEGGWERLVHNDNIHFNEELLDMYVDQWDWGVIQQLDNVTWTEALIKKYSERWTTLEDCAYYPPWIRLINRWDSILVTEVLGRIIDLYPNRSIKLPGQNWRENEN